MKRKILYTALLITTSNLMMGYAGYGSEAGRKALPKGDQGIIQEAETKYEGTKERVKKRGEGRKLQKKGKKIEKEVKGVTEPLSSIGTTVGMVASASGDPHAKAAAAAFKLAISAIDTLGSAISQIVIAVGRYQERSQQIFSTVEVLLEDLQKSIEKKKSLEKKLKELLVVEKLPEPSQSSSRLKQLGKGVVDAAKTVEIKAHQAVDILTNEKSKREEKIKAIQAELRVENENYAEIIRLLQIKLLQDAAKELDKHIHITDTLVGLEKDAVFYQKAKEGIPASESKQTAEIEAKEAQIKNELVFYQNFRKTLPEKDEELRDPLPKSGEVLGDRENFIEKLREGSVIKKLVKERKVLRDKIAELTELTQRGDSLYLQEREVNLDSAVNRTAIIGIYKEIDALKSQIEALGTTPPTKAVTNSEPLKKDARSQPEPLQKGPSAQAPTTQPSAFTESIIEGRKNLRPSQGIPQRPLSHKSGE